jgi:hypothetical protein
MANKESESVTRDKKAKFVELANKRVARALKDLSLIGNLANRRNYEYDEEQAKKIIRALQHELDLVKSTFASESSGRRSTFEL